MIQLCNVVSLPVLPIIISSSSIAAVAVSRILKYVYFNSDSFNNHL